MPGSYRGLNDDLAILVNNTLVLHTSFLATNTQLCVLMQLNRLLG